MTTTQIPLAERLTPRAVEEISRSTATMVLNTMAVEDDTTAFDIQIALDHFLDALGGHDLPPAMDPAKRPASDDTRPLYQRVDSDPDDSLKRSFRKQLTLLQFACILITDEQAFHEYLDATKALYVAFGLPTEDDFDQAQYPGVKNSLGDILDKLGDAGGGVTEYQGG